VEEVLGLPKPTDPLGRFADAVKGAAALADAVNAVVSQLAEVPPPVELDESGRISNVMTVEVPPPARRLSAMDWDEFVAGHRAGLIEWNTARLSLVEEGKDRRDVGIGVEMALAASSRRPWRAGPNAIACAGVSTRISSRGGVSTRISSRISSHSVGGDVPGRFITRLNGLPRGSGWMPSTGLGAT